MIKIGAMKYAISPYNNVQPHQDWYQWKGCIIKLKNVKRRGIPGLRKRLATSQEVVCPTELAVRSVEGLTCL
jgi:hypothetical protein